MAIFCSLQLYQRSWINHPSPITVLQPLCNTWRVRSLNISEGAIITSLSFLDRAALTGEYPKRRRQTVYELLLSPEDLGGRELQCLKIRLVWTQTHMKAKTKPLFQSYFMAYGKSWLCISQQFSRLDTLRLSPNKDTSKRRHLPRGECLPHGSPYTLNMHKSTKITAIISKDPIISRVTSTLVHRTHSADVYTSEGGFLEDTNPLWLSRLSFTHIDHRHVPIHDDNALGAPTPWAH